MKTQYLLLFCFSLLSCIIYAQVRVVAHRGYWTLPGAAQNSLTALSFANKAGVFASEFDVWMIKDNKLVVNHDKKFKGIDMENATLSQVRRIKLDNNEQLPTLNEYLEFALKNTNIRLILEMKSSFDIIKEDKAVRRIVKSLRKYDLIERTDIIAFSINACLTFKKMLPNSKIYYLGGDLPPKKIKSMGLAGLDYSIKVLKQHPEWIKEAHQLGLEVNVWTVDKKEDMLFFINLEVDYITTNYPELLQKLLQK